VGLCFDDIRLGQFFVSAAVVVVREEMLDFARRFDRNPFHHDEELARQAGYRDIIASGFYSLSLSFNLFFNLRLWDEAGLASPGLDQLRWLRPVYPGDELHIRAQVVERRLSRSNPEVGLVHFRHDTINQDGETARSVIALHRLRCRVEVERGED
jgi:acyl dehydratase